MAVEWFYTSNKQQVGPVSWDELRQRAASGALRRDELVWTEGMSAWVRADRQNGVFVDGPSAVQIGADAPPPAPRAQSRRGRDDDRDDEDRDDRDRDDRPKGRRTRKKGGGSYAGLWIGLGIGAFVLMLMLVGCVGLGVTVWLIDKAGEQIGPAGVNYTTSLGPGGHDQRTFSLRAGQRVNIDVITTRMPGPFQPDVDLFVERGGRLIASDVRVHPDCHVVFVAPANDTYSVRISNLGPGRASSRVAITAN